MEKWCQENGWIIVRMFIDRGVEGSKKQREQFQEMMSLARQIPRPVDGIVIWSFSRFARNQLHSQYYKADLCKRGFVVLSKSDDVPGNEMAPIFESIIDWKNQRFLEDLSADVRRGLVYLAEQGFQPNGVAAVGYRFEFVELGTRHNGEARLARRLVMDEDTRDAPCAPARAQRRSSMRRSRAM
jgi:site-specific DNA recombinase